MKRVNGVWSQICTIENLKLADKKARKGKRNQKGVKEHDKNKDKNILDLYNSLLNGTYKTSKYHIFTITEEKEREIYQLPFYPDRIFHHAIMNLLEKIFVDCFISQTYNCIKKRGIHRAASDVEKAVRGGAVGIVLN